MSRIKLWIILSLFSLSALFIGCSQFTIEKPDAEHCLAVERQPAIYPDYISVTLPPNIAPINFLVQESAEKYYVEISGEQGAPIKIGGKNATINIPLKPWRKLLDANKGKTISITVYIKNSENNWIRFESITNQIAEDAIDSHLVYRLMKPVYQYYNKLTLYERDLTDFDIRPIAYNKSTGNNCINCHSFHNYNPDRFIYHQRGGEVGTNMILAYDGKVTKIDTKTSFNPATAYRSWHPGGKFIAFAWIVVKQMFHSIGENRDVYDRVSDLLLFDVENSTITTSPKVSTTAYMETYPEWSPDGKYIYFCRAPELQVDDPHNHPYKKIKYDLMRIACDVEQNTWGEVEPVVIASEIDSSVAHPKISPDGRYLLFCMTEFTNFPLYNTGSDLYLVDLETRKVWKPENINSDRAESYHAWSSNGHWVVFSSKRDDNLCTHFYFSYFDGNGHFSKPFILPRKDPEIYQSQFEVYNVAEFIKGPIQVSPRELIRATWSEDVVKTKLAPEVTKKKDAAADVPMYQN